MATELQNHPAIHSLDVFNEHLCQTLNDYGFNAISGDKLKAKQQVSNAMIRFFRARKYIEQSHRVTSAAAAASSSAIASSSVAPSSSERAFSPLTVATLNSFNRVKKAMAKTTRASVSPIKQINSIANLLAEAEQNYAKANKYLNIAAVELGHLDKIIEQLEQAKHAVINAGEIKSGSWSAKLLVCWANIVVPELNPIIDTAQTQLAFYSADQAELNELAETEMAALNHGIMSTRNAAQNHVRHLMEMMHKSLGDAIGRLVSCDKYSFHDINEHYKQINAYLTTIKQLNQFIIEKNIDAPTPLMNLKKKFIAYLSQKLNHLYSTVIPETANAMVTDTTADISSLYDETINLLQQAEKTRKLAVANNIRLAHITQTQLQKHIIKSAGKKITQLFKADLVRLASIAKGFSQTDLDSAFTALDEVMYRVEAYLNELEKFADARFPDIVRTEARRFKDKLLASYQAMPRYTQIEEVKQQARLTAFVQKHYLTSNEDTLFIILHDLQQQAGLDLQHLANSASLQTFKAGLIAACQRAIAENDTSDELGYHSSGVIVSNPERSYAYMRMTELLILLETSDPLVQTLKELTAIELDATQIFDIGHDKITSALATSHVTNMASSSFFLTIPSDDEETEEEEDEQVIVIPVSSSETVLRRLENIFTPKVLADKFWKSLYDKCFKDLIKLAKEQADIKPCPILTTPEDVALAKRKLSIVTDTLDDMTAAITLPYKKHLKNATTEQSRSKIKRSLATTILKSFKDKDGNQTADYQVLKKHRNKVRHFLQQAFKYCAFVSSFGLLKGATVLLYGPNAGSRTTSRATVDKVMKNARRLGE